MWRQFGAALAAFSVQADEDAAIVRSARETFAAFERWVTSDPRSGYRA